MEKRNLFRILLLCLCIINLTSCEKEEDDFLKEGTENTTIVKGKIVTTDGQALPGITVKVDYHEGIGFHYSLLRHKAEVKTDKNGNYKLEFYIKDDEMEEEEDSPVSKYFRLTVDMQQLDPKQYILPFDMVSVSGPDSPVAHLDPTIPATTGGSFDPAPQRDTTYTENFYIPRKRYIPVTLKGLDPQKETNSFGVVTGFPWGGESDEANKLIDTPYSISFCAGNVYVATSAEQTLEVPFALNENNIIRIVKSKDGAYTTEDIPVYVTKDTPEKLVYEY